MEIAAGVAVAAALDCIHADSDSAVLVGRHRVGGMRKAALRLCALARPALVLAAHLQQTPGSTQVTAALSLPHLYLECAKHKRQLETELEGLLP